MTCSDRLAETISMIAGRFPRVEFLAWDTLALNEFLNHQIAHSTVFVEVESMLESAAFEHLRESLNGTVLYKPGIADLSTYWEPGAVVVQKLVSQSPGNKTDTHLPVIENLVVELFANKLLGALFSSAEIPSVLEQMFESYIVDESKMLRYAGRRNCRGRILEFIKEKTGVRLRTLG